MKLTKYRRLDRKARAIARLRGNLDALLAKAKTMTASQLEVSGGSSYIGKVQRQLEQAIAAQ